MIENVQTIKQINENIMAYIKFCVNNEKFERLENFLKEHDALGKEKYAIQHRGTREKTEEKVMMFQIGLENKDEDLWFVVEEAELNEKLRTNKV